MTAIAVRDAQGYILTLQSGGEPCESIALSSKGSRDSGAGTEAEFVDALLAAGEGVLQAA